MTPENPNSIPWKKLWAVIRKPAFFIVVNFFLVNSIFVFLPHTIGNTFYNLGRIGIIFYGGWLVAKKRLGNRWYAAAVGVFLYFIDHVVLKGGIFLLNYVFKPDGLGLAAFGGVLASFVVFIPLSMLVAMIGALYAQSRQERAPADPE